MNEEAIPVEKNNPTHPPRGVARRPKKSSSQRYPFELKLRAVKLYLEEGFSQAAITEELGLGVHTVAYWAQRYQAFGEEGLKRAPSDAARRARLPQAVTDRIVDLKKEHPSWGIKTISQWLRRMLFLPASAETVRQKLHQANLMSPPPSPRKRNLTRPRFFERATPNQMWQSDIFTFRLGGRYAYVVAFLDDYSRFIVGADLFRSPTAEAVIEVYRQAIAEYKPPKEMLTDNGRQYTSWRGTSRFEAELKKDGVAHFKSRPQHPMTLGKIERFWETLWQQFLTRAQFASFEDARERIRFWIKHYNHKRPNQGIGGLCPADRFFEIQSALRQTIEAGIKENLLEMALRGQPRAPFYMVGRLDGQSVVLRAEKGKLKLSVSDQQNHEQELTYELHPQTPDGKNPTQKENANSTAQCPGQNPGGAGGVDRTLQAGGSLPPVEHQLGHLQPMAATGHGGHAPGTGVPCEPQQRRGVEPAPASVAPTASTHVDGRAPDQSAGTVAEQSCQPISDSGKNPVDEGPSQTTGRGDLQSPLRPDDRDGGGADAGHLPPAILPVGTTRLAGVVERTGEPTHRPTQDAERSGEGEVATPGATTGATSPGTSATGTVAPTAPTMGTALGPAGR